MVFLRQFQPRTNRLTAAVGFIVLLHCAARCPAQSPLRYDFRPGDRLVYQRRAIVASLETGAIEQHITDQIQIWCFERTDTDVLVLLDLVHFVDGRAEPVRGVVLRIDSRGVRQMTAATPTRIAELDAAFDIVPVLRAAFSSGPAWVTTNDPFGRRWRCRRAQPDADREGHIRVTFTVEDTTGVGRTIGEERFGTFWFDADAGCVTRVESELRHRAAGVTVQAKIKLIERRSNSRRWADDRLSEARTFLRTLDNEDRLLRDVLARPGRIDETVRHLKRLWSGLAGQPRARGGSPLLRIAAARQRRVASSEKLLREAAALSRKWLGRRVHDWSLQGPSGRTVRSAEFRDQIAIECFWSADSLWGLRSLEMMRRLAGALDQRRVRIVCLNMDSDVELARRAIQSAGSDLTHVLAESLSANEPDLDFPTVRVIDREGVVRQIAIGWRPDLYRELEPLLDRLLR